MGTAFLCSRLGVLAAILGATGIALLGDGGAANAHPQGDTSINRYVRVELYEGRAHIHYVLDYSEIPTLFWEFNNNVDSDGRVGAAEKDRALRGFEDELSGGLRVIFAGEAVPLRSLDSSIELFEGDMGLRVLRVALAFEAEVAAGAPGELVIEDRNYEGRSGWRTITVAPSSGAAVEMDASLMDDPSAALTLFPDEWLQFPPMTWTVSVGWDPRTGAPAPSAIELDRWRPSSTNSWNRLLQRDGPWWVVLMAMAIAFAFGALDAMGPGHGKTIVGSYMASSGSGRREAVTLGVVAAGTHTAVVLSIAVVALKLGPAVLGPEPASYLLGIAGAVIVAVGVVMVWQHRRGHEHRDVRANIPKRRGRLLAVGAAGGMVPCPASILVLLAAIAGGDLGYGFALIAAFGLGMGTVLVAVGLAVVGMGRAWAHPKVSTIRESRLGAAASAALPVASGGVVVLAGAVLVLAAFTGAGRWLG